MARITCFDGVGCIGGNKLLLEDGKTKLWLDFGLDFGRMGAFYEEFLKPKGCLGLYEPVRMGLLPPIPDLYRSDLLCALEDPWVGVTPAASGEFSGILVSHAHIDHLGQLHYVREDIPIYMSAMTLAMAKAYQDSGMGGQHHCYTNAYEPTETGELRSAHHAKNPSRSRPVYLVGESPSDALSEYWMCTPGSKSSRGRQHLAEPVGQTADCGGLRVRRFPVDHSVYGASAWAVETSAGWIAYTGDIRCHGRQAASSWRFAEEVAKLKPRALIIEGTRIAHEDSATEDQIGEAALEEVRKAKGLVVADFGPRNIERLDVFLSIAKEAGRKLIITPKDAFLIDKMHMVDPVGIPSPNDPALLIYDKYEASENTWKREVAERFPDKFVKPSEISSRQDEAVCCFSFFDVNELAYIRPTPGSVWIYSTCEAFNEEMMIDVKRLGNWIDEFGMKFPSDPRLGEKGPFHVSGHACRPHLMKLIDIISPQTVIPVHTENPGLFAELLAGKADVRIPERGKPIEL